ncbi:16S rRNA (cytidine(1402)-2'-O)-methyltransferase [bacterium]|nr:16S rRNA (cytidine(1402)-2'-O)-methyltransferase [bacterium]
MTAGSAASSSDHAGRTGTLYIVATPIGNLSDLSPRAVETLTSVDLIAAEDTRHTSILLREHGITVPMQSYHEHNAQKALPGLLHELEQGKSIAYASDAGTPAVSDPGYKLVRAVLDAGGRVVPIPGPSAVLTALVASGLPTDRFTFEGFLPRKKGRQTRLKELAGEPRTMIFFESPKRLARTLHDMAEHFGEDRNAAVCRELTKTFEEVVREPLGALARLYEPHPPKGEITLVVAGYRKPGKSDPDITETDQPGMQLPTHEDFR